MSTLEEPPLDGESADEVLAQKSSDPSIEIVKSSAGKELGTSLDLEGANASNDQTGTDLESNVASPPHEGTEVNE